MSNEKAQNPQGPLSQRMQLRKRDRHLRDLIKHVDPSTILITADAVKDWPPEAIAAVQMYERGYQAQLKRANAEAAGARIDEMLDIMNRRGFEEAVKDHLAGWDRHEHGQTSGIPASQPAEKTLVMLDLDGFKAINDNLGHMAGDDGLKHVATFLKKHKRPTDVVARIGGDEFGVLFDGTEDKARARMEELRTQMLEQGFHYAPGKEAYLSYSIGTQRLDAQSYSEAQAAAAREAAEIPPDSDKKPRDAYALLLDKADKDEVKGAYVDKKSKEDRIVAYHKANPGVLRLFSDRDPPAQSDVGR